MVTARARCPVVVRLALPGLVRTAHAGAPSRTPASRGDQQFMIEIKKAKLTQRDVKNEGTSGDVYENKGEDDTMSCYRDDFLAEHLRIVR